MMDKAIDIYYKSRISEKTHWGVEGIQYLDYKVLAQILYETEGDLFDEQESLMSVHQG